MVPKEYNRFRIKEYERLILLAALEPYKLTCIDILA